MKKRLLAVLLAAILCLGIMPAALAAAPAQDQVYQSMIALKTEYPEGMRWTNDNYYSWKGGIYSAGYGCAGFSFLLSDAAFGDLPARMETEIVYDEIRVGDILRVNDNTHSVIVLEVYSDHLIIAEGNYNSSIHWGRSLSKTEALAADYVMTRYPAEEESEPEAQEPAAPAESEAPAEAEKPIEPAFPFADVAEDSPYRDAIAWAVEQGITNGTSDTAFSPGETCTIRQILTFLWRANGRPGGAEDGQSDLDAAAAWARGEGILADDSDTSLPCTRALAMTYLWYLAGSPTVSAAASFSDVAADTPGVWAISWAVEKGITKGTSDTTFSPDGICTRGQIVTFLYRNK